MSVIEKLYYDAMVARLSGISPKEVDLFYWEDEDFCVFVTVELLPGDRCIVRNYYSGTNNLQWENRYKKCKLDGISMGWREDGTIQNKYRYKDGEFIESLFQR